MAIQFPDFQRISFQEANPLLTGFQQSVNTGNSLTDMISKRLAQERLRKLMPYVQPEAQADLLAKQLANQFNPDIWKSEIGLRGAQTNKMNTMTPLEANQLKLTNLYYPGLVKSLINLNNMGGRGLGTGGKEELMFQQFVSKDNPQLGNDPNKVYEAANALREGRTTLSDGTPLNQLSYASKKSFDRIIRGSTTSGALTPLINAGQSEQEINVLSKYAQEGLKPYGNTLLNKSPEQIIDSFKNDEDSQKKLGKFIASQQLQYEIAQNEIRLANGQPGVNSTQELMHIGQQTIDAKYPKLSYTARQEANKFFLDALKEGYQARKKVGVSPSSILGNNSKNITKELVNNKTNSKYDFSNKSDDELRKMIGM